MPPMKKPSGCLLLIIILLIGLVIGYVYGLFETRQLMSYIDRDEAIEIGLMGMQHNCRDRRFTHPVDCKNFRVTEVIEDKTGWWITYLSLDGRREGSKLIKRRGEYESTSYENFDGVLMNGVENSPPPNAAPATSSNSGG
jgi:hypothetical protein